MGKDPAVLFYTSDFLVGTSFFTMEQRGQYITLLCQQHQLGKIPESHLIEVCGTIDSPVAKKFIKDSDGTYYQPRMRNEADKRKSYCDSRKENRKRCSGKTHVYLIKDTVSGYIKIGASINPERRLFELQNSNTLKKPQEKHDLKLVFVSPMVSIYKEFEIQSEFKYRQVFNEWYNLNKDEIDIIKHMFDHMCEHMENENENRDKDSSSQEGVKGGKRKKAVYATFLSPTIEEVKAYIKESGSNFVDADYFHNYYTSNGWKVSGRPMVDWKATVRNWIIREKKNRNIPKDNVIWH